MAVILSSFTNALGASLLVTKDPFSVSMQTAFALPMLTVGGIALLGKAGYHVGLVQRVGTSQLPGLWQHETAKEIRQEVHSNLLCSWL